MGREFDAGFEGGVGPIRVVAHPIKIAQGHPRGGEFRIERQRLVQLGLNVGDLSLAEIKRRESEMVAGPIFVLLPQLFDLLNCILDIGRGESGLGQDQEGVLLPGLLFKSAHSIRTRLF